MKTGERKRFKNTVFVAREGFDDVFRRGGNIVKVRTEAGGRVRKIMRQPLNPEAGDLEAAFKRKKKNQRFMVRRRGASGTAGSLDSLESLDDLKAYKQVFRARFLSREIERLRQKGKRAKDAEKQARQWANEIIEDWYLVEYETIRD